MHPLQSFSGVGVPPLEGKVFAIEGDAGAVRTARQIVRELGGSPVQISGATKILYHAAATVAAGGVLSLLEMSTRLMMAAGMKRREAMRALFPLTRQVLENFEGLGPTRAWTGPLSRGDYNIVASHAGAMQSMPVEFAEAYAALNHLSARLLSLDPDTVLAELKGIFGDRNGKAKAMGGGA
jgi:predicted short-subunit dehydrogenase-like oxidoreductase (DUF2520 family)